MKTAFLCAVMAATCSAAPVGLQEPTIYGCIGNWPSNEGAGAVVSDKSGLGNPAYFTNSPTWVAGVAGSAVKFNGTSSYESVPASSLFTATGSCSLSAWCNLVSLPASSQVMVITKSNDAPGYGWGIFLTIVSGGILGGVATTVPSTTSTGTATIAIATNVWVHTCTVFDNAAHTIALYTNGVLASSVSLGTKTTMRAGNGVVQIGAMQPEGFYLNGSVDDGRIYNRAISPAEVKGLYNGGRSTQK